MARFIAMLLVGPWLAVLSWLYWLYARRHAAGIPAWFDAWMLVLGWLAAVVAAATIFQVAAAYGGALWQQIAAAWVAYPAYAVVMSLGLLRHWLARKRA